MTRRTSNSVSLCVEVLEDRVVPSYADGGPPPAPEPPPTSPPVTQPPSIPSPDWLLHPPDGGTGLPPGYWPPPPSPPSSPDAGCFPPWCWTWDFPFDCQYPQC
jgi:hypothetical protein